MQALLDWCATQLPGNSPLTLVSVAGDASFRRYFRVHGSAPSRIAVYAPPDKERNLEFTRIAALLRAAGVNAPEVFGHEREQGFLLLSDFGDALLLGALDAHSVDSLYAKALEVLLAMQCAAVQIDGWRLPDYSAALLRQEMELFPHWYLERLLGIELTAAERDLIEATFAALLASAAEQPQCFVHRDYHSRNLMLLADGELGVIDFQDAVFGPISYDLVSLLRDCYVAWPVARVRAWATRYAERATAAGLMPAVSSDRFQRWFDWMGLQRHIKVLGIFARLWLRDGKPGYLNDLPLVMRYTLDVSGWHADLADFHAWFRDRVVPVAQQQSWYRNA